MCVGVGGSNSVVVSSELGREGIGLALELWQQTRHPSSTTTLGGVVAVAAAFLFNF